MRWFFDLFFSVPFCLDKVYQEGFWIWHNISQGKAWFSSFGALGEWAYFHSSPSPTRLIFIARLLLQGLKGLSHEIDFKNFDKKFAELGLTKGRASFEFFGGSNYFKTQKVYLLRLMLVCVGITIVSFLFFFSPPNYKWSIIEQGWM